MLFSIINNIITNPILEALFNFSTRYIMFSLKFFK